LNAKLLKCYLFDYFYLILQNNFRC